MAQSKLEKRIKNMVYGLGAAIVIIGALFKIQHLEFGVLTGGVMLTIGLVVEAGVFVYSAFESPDQELDWSKVYPELSGAGSTSKRGGSNAVANQEKEEELLSKKLDAMLKEAKIDAKLMESLGNSIKSFEGAAKGIAPATEAMASQKKYSQEMGVAASQMESLNSLYKVQLESASKQAEANEAVAQNAGKLKEQMESLTSNLNSLNGVYGGMLTAMRPKA
ncbi:MAG: gliding motility protein GldL [Psychroflexus sp.]|uniref:type IX secretion system motor protein PorL/GldL n=1 Tax=Psychroflexus sp. S27 TaxID=1982757 RepID=UPI000C2A989D|nr:gliding motility protein GldL [Psychroflexus sp. S27]PJX21911.1 gliding motility protein GldL [Psychroflexus sp. S27]